VPRRVRSWRSRPTPASRVQSIHHLKNSHGHVSRHKYFQVHEPGNVPCSFEAIANRTIQPRVPGANAVRS
jgi:hypothetical protein